MASRVPPAGPRRRMGLSARDEERAARQQHRALEKARRAREKRSQASRAEIICEELAKPRAVMHCRCGIRPDMSMRQLMALGAGCTAGDACGAGYVCPTLDAIRRRLGR